MIRTTVGAWYFNQKLGKDGLARLHYSSIQKEVVNATWMWRNSILVHSGKKQNDTGPDSHHSSEFVRVSDLKGDLPRSRIKFL